MGQGIELFRWPGYGDEKPGKSTCNDE